MIGAGQLGGIIVVAAIALWAAMGSSTASAAILSAYILVVGAVLAVPTTLLVSLGGIAGGLTGRKVHRVAEAPGVFIGSVFGALGSAFAWSVLQMGLELVILVAGCIGGVLLAVGTWMYRDARPAVIAADGAATAVLRS